MEGGQGKRGRVRGREETPPPIAKKRCTQATPPAKTAPAEANGNSNGTNGASHMEIEALPAGRGGRRASSRTSASSRGSTSSPPASPARRGGRRAPEEKPQTPTRTSGRNRQFVLASKLLDDEGPTFQQTFNSLTISLKMC